jgi:hypothetical protein
LQAIEAIYAKHCAARTSTSIHLPRLRALADGCDVAVEFGVKRGASASAMLLGADRVVSFDLVASLEARELKRVAGDRWDYRIEDSRTADVPECELMFSDSLHTYAQCKAELEAHADKARRYLVFHDTLTFGSVGANGETGEQLWAYRRGESVPIQYLGIRPAIDELMIRDPSWHIVAHYTDSHGLLVLQRTVKPLGRPLMVDDNTRNFR